MKREAGRGSHGDPFAVVDHPRQEKSGPHQRRLLACAELKQNASTALAGVAAMLSKHPEIARWNELMDRLNIEDVDEGLFLFMQAARWPDDLKRTKYAHPSRRFVDIPNRPGFKVSDRVKAVAEARVVLAGCRLADLLDATFE